MIDTIAVLGAGNGGTAFAGHLAAKGFGVRLYESERFGENIAEIKRTKRITLTGALELEGRIEAASTRIMDVLRGAQLVIVAVPGFAHDHMMAEMTGCLEEGQFILFVPGNYGALRFRKLFRELGIDKKAILCEAPSMLYACRRTGPASVAVRAVKRTMPVGVFPAVRTGEVMEELRDVFQEFTATENVLSASMSNPNCMVHVPASVLNTGWIESTGGKFDFYWEGISRSVAKVIEEMDRERVAIGEGVGVDLCTLEKFFEIFYDLRAGSLHELLTTSEIHGRSSAPPDLGHRYVQEDTPFGLVPLASFGRHLGVPTPNIDAVIRLASTMTGRNYFKEGISVQKMGLAGMDRRAIAEFLQQG
ncbi:MAG: NAD/NADP octopine/nopaline dehydrogenase family protein [Thermovirgaceae bacterium]